MTDDEVDDREEILERAGEMLSSASAWIGLALENLQIAADGRRGDLIRLSAMSTAKGQLGLAQRAINVKFQTPEEEDSDE